jgi:uncharacterized protein
MPVGPGPVPAAVLVHGSGPGDRDATGGQIKQFKDLALGLGSRRIAVLRYDKRTKVHAQLLRKLTGLTVKTETIDDAIAAVQLLRSTSAVDPNRIVVLGHSLGGMLVPRIAAAGPPFSGFIVMAGAARPIEQAVVEQARYLAQADGAISAEELGSRPATLARLPPGAGRRASSRHHRERTDKRREVGRAGMPDGGSVAAGCIR